MAAQQRAQRGDIPGAPPGLRKGLLTLLTTFKTSPGSVISIPFSSSSFYFSAKLNYTCKLPNRFPLYGIYDIPLFKK